MPLLKSTVKKLRNANATYRATIAYKAENATKKTREALRIQRNAHFKALETVPFFKKILSKKIHFQIYSNGEPKNYSLLGVGFQGEGNFRRTVLIIDDKGQTLFFGEKMRGIRTIWEPYRMLKEKKSFVTHQKSYEYSELESWGSKQENEVYEVSHNIKYHLDKVNFEQADARKLKQIKRYF